MKRINTLLISVISLFYLSPSVSLAESAWDKIQEKYSGPLNIKVYHSPSCGCCKDWLLHLKKHGFTVNSIPTENMQAVKQELQLPGEVASCHTAIIDGYLIEGHVPADDIKRLLKQRPEVMGLSVPQMPTGTPGMEMGDKKDPFAVISFDKAGNYHPFRQYWNY